MSIDDLVGIELAHARLLDERIGLEPRARRRDVEERQRVLRADAGERQNPRLVEMGRAGDRDDVDAEAERARDDIAEAAVIARRRRRTGRRGPRRSPRRPTRIGERQRDLEPERRRALERKAPAQDPRARPFAAQQHLGRDAATATPASAGRAPRLHPSDSLSDRTRRPPPSRRQARRTTGRHARPCPARATFPSCPAAC